MSLGLAIVALVGVSAYRPRFEAGKGAQAMDAAFRDGLYQAKLDVQDGRAPRLRTGRWGHNADRVVFIAGYEQGYREYSEARSGKLAEPSAAELAGYCDGTLDGAADRIKAQPFQVEKTELSHRGPGLFGSQCQSRSVRQVLSQGLFKRLPARLLPSAAIEGLEIC